MTHDDLVTLFSSKCDGAGHISSWIDHCDCDSVWSVTLQSFYGVGAARCIYPHRIIISLSSDTSFSPHYFRMCCMFINTPGEGDGVRGDLYGVHINGRLLWKRDWRVGSTMEKRKLVRYGLLNDAKFSVLCKINLVIINIMYL